MFLCFRFMPNKCSILALIQCQWLHRATLNICIPTYDERYTHILSLLLIQCYAAYVCLSGSIYVHEKTKHIAQKMILELRAPWPFMMFELPMVQV